MVLMPWAMRALGAVPMPRPLGDMLDVSFLSARSEVNKSQALYRQSNGRGKYRK